ncbi:MAG: lamin tail domain-containing protein [Halobacteria archaeon]
MVRDLPDSPRAPHSCPPGGDTGQISLDFLFGIVLFLFAFTYVILFIPGLFSPFDTESDVTTLQGDKTAIWLVEEKLADDKSRPGVVNLSKLTAFMAELNGTDTQKTLLRQEAGLISDIRRLDLNVSVDWLNGTVNTSGNATPSSTSVGQTRRVVKVVNVSLNESGMSGHPLIHEVFTSTSADAVVLFNPAKDPVDLARWRLTDGEQNLTFPNATLIGPRGFLTIVRGSASSFVRGCTPDLELVQAGSVNSDAIPNMVNATTAAPWFDLDSADEVCLYNHRGNLTDAVNIGAGGDDCGDGGATRTLSGANLPPFTSDLSQRRVNPGIEGAETDETDENWASSFGVFTPSCPATEAVISVRVW